jgi:hypothetical protein
MKREIMFIGGNHAGRFKETFYNYPEPVIRFPVYKLVDLSKGIPADPICRNPEYETYNLQKYRSANGAEFLWYVLEGIDPLEELSNYYRTIL